MSSDVNHVQATILCGVSVVQSLDSVCLSLSADSPTLSSTNSGYRVVAPSDMHGGPIVFILSYMR